MTLLSFNQRELKTLGFGAAIADKYYSTLSAGEGQSVVKGFNAVTAYNQVAYAFRCVMLRAQEISRVPRALLDEQGNDVTDKPEYKSLMVTDDLLLKLEISRCVYGQAYAVPRANPNGYNLGLEWAASPSITPWYSPITSKVERFDRNTGSRPIPLTLDQIVYLWNINIADENKPGPGETMVALSAESMLWALDAFAAGFFNSGAVKVTVFPVDPATQQTDITTFQNFLNRRLSGVMNAFRNVVMRVRGELKPVVIGSDLKDTQAVELTQEKKADIAHAHGIPPNVVDGTYKYATADSEYLNFIAGTIIPRTDQTFEVMNAQFYSKYRLKLVSQADKMEIMQTAQLAQSQSLMQLTGGKPLMTVKQACEWLGIRPEILIEQGLAMACPYCDAVNMLNTAKCTECGAPLPMQARPVPVGSDRPVPVPIDSKPVPVDAMSNKPVAVKATPKKTIAGHEGAMIAFMLDRDVAALLGSIGDYKPDHMTLVFVAKDASTLDADKVTALKVALQAFATRCAPFVASISGVGRFDESHTISASAIYASVDSPSLPEFRAELLALVRAVGIEPVANHGFSPHITLGYIDYLQATPDIPIPLISIGVGSVALVMNGEVDSFPLTGSQIFKALPEPTHDEIVKALTDWRKAAIEAARAKDTPHMTSNQFENRLPTKLLGAITADLMAVKSMTAVRDVFERHWPKPPAKDEPTEGERLIEALVEATKALEAVR